MSFFKKLFGGRSFADCRKNGDEEFERGDFLNARLAYVDALDRLGDASATDEQYCRGRVDTCLDEMAKQRITAAADLSAEGHKDLAEEELRHAMEMAASEEIREEARQAHLSLEEADAIDMAEEAAELTDDHRWALLAGTWTAEQQKEYDGYGEAFRTALLAVHARELKAGSVAMEDLLHDAEEPVYLWLEIGRCRHLSEEIEAAEEALEEFLECLAEDESPGARLSALAELASLADGRDDEATALQYLEEAAESLPEDPRPFFLMGQYLRSKGHGAEGAEVLAAALPFLSQERPDWSFLQELGLCLFDSGKDAEAAHYLDAIIDQFVARRELNFPPTTAVTRATLYERAGKLDKAADLYAGLARGNDRKNHQRYHREAARLLIALELPSEARTMLTRALALAREDAEASAEIKTQLDALGAV